MFYVKLFLYARNRLGLSQQFEDKESVALFPTLGISTLKGLCTCQVII